MIAFFTFINAILLSGVAAYYSVIGLASIFPGSFWPVVLMGAVLESAKLVTASWLYRNWNTAPKILKYYLTAAVAILMLITSMGIFGYLSKAHLEHSADVGPVADKVAIYDEKIKTLKENIDASRKALKQMDEAVDQTMGRTTDEKGALNAISVRRSQQKERDRILSDITESQKTLAKVNEERAPLANELRKAESDFGPIKYVAELIYGSGDREIIDKAVRLVIMLIMIVFDPLAVLLLISANMTMAQKNEKKKKEVILHTETEIPVFTEEKTVIPKSKRTKKKKAVDETELPSETVETIEIQKENVAFVAEPEPLVITDVTTGESIVRHVQIAPGTHEEHHEPVKKLEPEYDYKDEFAFRKKDEK